MELEKDMENLTKEELASEETALSAIDEIMHGPDLSGVEIHTDEQNAEVTAVEGEYGADQIQILEGLEAVRKRKSDRSHVVL